MIGPLHPGHNVVVGRNGSGKSNFFAAIRFVLNDAYTKLNATEERSSLIYVRFIFLIFFLGIIQFNVIGGKCICGDCF